MRSRHIHHLIKISIHALREESDAFYWNAKSQEEIIFQSTLSVRRATTKTRVILRFPVQFQSTLSVRRATQETPWLYGAYGISIHALREESDGLPRPDGMYTIISIHALREENDHELRKLPQC